MGYRSVVKVLITSDSPALINKAYKMIPKKLFSEYNWKENDFRKDLCRIEFHAEYVKWYNGYEDVELFNKWMSEVEELLGEQGGIHFVRIGEDISDVEENAFGSPFEYINICRYSEF